MATPLCPECRKQMTARYICLHCGYDDQRLHTTSLWKPTPMPYECSRCGKPAGKLIDDKPVCGECFTKGWGRLPSMPLAVEKEEAPLYISDKPPKKARRKKKPKNGGK